MSYLIRSGNWTPIVTLTGAGTAPQYSTALGTWTKVGRIIFWNIQLSGDGGNEGSGAGIITISLPFTSGPSQIPIIQNGGVAINGAQENNLSVVHSASSTTIQVKYQQSASQLQDFTGADQNNTTRSIYLTGKSILN